MLTLVGVALYTALVPGHIVSQVSAAASDAAASGQPLAALDCHRGKAHADGMPQPAAPTKPKSDCPFCKGYAAFQTALVAGADAGILDAAHVTPDARYVEAAFIPTAFTRPHNRGPPAAL